MNFPKHYPHIANDQNGFSLIEIIMSLLLLGIIGAIGSFGLTTFVNSYATSRTNTDTVSKAQLAMHRIVKEFIVIESIGSGTASSITFTSKYSDSLSKTFILTKSGSNLTLNDGTSTDILTDQVSSFSLSYYTVFDGTPATTFSGCNNPIYIEKNKYEWDDSDNDEVDIEFEDTTGEGLSDFRVTYGGINFIPAHSGSGDEVELERDPVPYFNTAYVWSVSHGINCYIEIKIRNKTGTGGTGLDSSPPATKHTIIEVALALTGADGNVSTFTTRVVPRNM